MNSKGHLLCSLVKSILRILGCILLFIFVSSMPILGLCLFAESFLLAEVLGIVEELLDMR